jgi:hypothetical protein
MAENPGIGRQGENRMMPTIAEVKEIKADNTHYRCHRWTQEEREMVRLHYDGTRESIIRLQGLIGASFYGVKGQIANMGLARVKPADWSPEDLKRLEAMIPHYSVKTMAQKLGRSENAVHVKATRLHFSLRYRDGWYTKAEVSEICGVDHKKVQCWIDRGDLKASWHHGHKPSMHGSGAWHIERKDLASFIRAHCQELQGRNIDLFILLEVLGVIGTGDSY